MGVFLLRRGERLLHVPLTYRGAPLPGHEDRLVGTLEHSVLGTRCAYDGTGDEVTLAWLMDKRTEVFEVQFTGRGFGWVVVHLDGIDLDELSEPIPEAWYLTAPEELPAIPPTPAAPVRA